MKSLNPAEVQYRPARSSGELEQILALQRINLKGTLPPEEERQEGFVTLTHSLPLLQLMQEACPQVVALWDNRVVGYALCLHPDLQDQVPALGPMFACIREQAEAPEAYRVMGQVCVAKEARGTGVFRAMYECLKQQCSPLPLITEVSDANRHSLGAHLAIGFRELAVHQEGDTLWHVVIWP